MFRAAMVSAFGGPSAAVPWKSMAAGPTLCGSRRARPRAAVVAWWRWRQWQQVGGEKRDFGGQRREDMER